MIVPMTKYSLLIFHKNVEDALLDLGKLGAFHVKRELDTQNEDMQALNQKMLRIEKALDLLSEHGNASFTIVPTPDGWTEDLVLTQLEEIEKTLEDFALQLSQTEKDIAVWQPWKTVNRQRLLKLSERGLKGHLFKTRADALKKSWKRQHILEVIGKEGEFVYFLVLTRENEPVEISAQEIELPATELKELLNKRNTLKAEMRSATDTLREIGQEEGHRLQSQLRIFQRLLEVTSVHHRSELICEDKLVLLEGFVPTSAKEEMDTVIKEHQIFSDEATSEVTDQPPVLLKNNAFSKLFEPITRMFALPNYGEMDLTPFFAPFFLLFFGFCLGDAIYGLLMFLVATVLKVLGKFSAHRAILSLVQLFGLATLVVGVITGTFFGVYHDGLEFGRFHSMFLDQQQLFYLSMVLGLVQIIFGLLVQAYGKFTRLGFLHGLPQIGWILIILGLIDINISELMPVVSKFIAYAGVSFVVLFADPSAGPLKSIGTGIWGLYGITGLFGDVLSYIRLFALGVSSGILGLVVNSMAVELLDVSYIGWLLFLVVMLLGHGLNICIASLGAFVHPLRLTFVEFYKNAGFEGGGKPYRPFDITTEKHT